MFNHQTHHRGQIHNMLSQAGIKPPQIDIPDFIIKKYAYTFNNKYRDQGLKSDPSELFTLHPMLITK